MTETALREAYEAQKGSLRAWGEFISETVTSTLKEEHLEEAAVETFLKIWPVVPRVKSTQSFIAKALRRGKNYQHPLDDITDKVGVRFVTLLVSEVRRVAHLVESAPHWIAEKARDYEEERLERPHHFDYQSVHYVLRNKKEMTLGGITVAAGTPCEVQIRTLLQHAYSELAHETVYKPKLAAERSVSRQVAKSMALIEATDDIFEGVKREIDAASAEITRVSIAASECYRELVGLSPIDNKALSDTILESYREFLSTISADTLRSFLSDRSFVLGIIRERAPLSILYAHGVIIVVYFLAAEAPDEIWKRWPLKLEWLESVYADLGISTDDRF